MNHQILVPIDFTEITENALKYAVGAAKISKTGITLLHIVEKDTLQVEAKSKLDALISKYNYTGVPMKHVVESGKISDIGRVAKSLEIGLVIMGTHGLKGMQYLIGSNALRVVSNSSVPFIITQNRPPKNDNIDHIVVPIDMEAEDKQILRAVISAAKSFDAEVTLFVAKHSDEFKENAVKRNLAFSKKYLVENGIKYKSTLAGSIDDFDTQLVDFASSTNADMIAIINHHEDGIKNLFGANFDQNIITNKEQIPVLILNSKDYSSVSDIFGTFS